MADAMTNEKFGKVVIRNVGPMLSGDIDRPIPRIREFDRGPIEAGREADFVFIHRAQRAPGRTLPESVAFGDMPGVGW